MIFFIIEDSETLLELLSEVFEIYGLNVFKAKNGLDGSDLFKSRQIDIVLTDIRMPGLDGTELSHRIRHQAPYKKIAVMTGGDPDVATKLFNDGTANYYFHKPFDLIYVCESRIAEAKMAWFG